MDIHKIKFSQPLPPLYDVVFMDGHYYWMKGDIESEMFCCRWMAYRSAWSHYKENKK